MKITKKYSTRVGAENWREYCSRQHPDKKIDIFRDLTKVSTYYVGVLKTTSSMYFILEDETGLPKSQFTICL